jgi:curli biogenesis system outer membrane secretion channel CsgG
MQEFRAGADRRVRGGESVDPLFPFLDQGIAMLKRTSFLLCAVVSSFGCVTNAYAEILAYSVSADREVPLPEDLSAVHSLNLVNLHWSDYLGAKTRLAVSKVDNTSGAESISIGDGSGPGADIKIATAGVPVSGIEAMLTDALNRTNRFRMVERQAIGNVLQEQDFGASGRVAAPSAAKIGGVLGAEMFVEASITHYEAGVSGSNFGGIGGLVGGNAGAVLGGLGVSKKKAAFGMNIRLVDAQSSEVVFSKQISREITESGLTFGAAGFGGDGAMGGFLSSYTKTPIGQTVMAAINEAAFELVRQIGTSPAKGSVIRVDGGQIYINLGEGSVQNGDALLLFRPGERLIDPETGLDLGSDDEEIGRLIVRETKEKFSLASVEASSKPVQPKDRVISTVAPPSIEYGVMVPELQKAPKKSRKR